MTKRELEKKSQGELVRMCEGKRLPHTGDKQALVARLLEWEKSQESEPEVKSEPVVEPAAPEPQPEPED